MVPLVYIDVSSASLVTDVEGKPIYRHVVECNPNVSSEVSVRLIRLLSF